MPTKKELIQAYKDLRRARRLVADPEVWIQMHYGYSSKRGDYMDGDVRYDEADRVCSLGALGKVQHKNGHQANKTQAAEFLRCAMGLEVYQFNDLKPHAVVVSAWDKAIKIAKGAVAAMVRAPKDEH